MDFEKLKQRLLNNGFDEDEIDRIVSIVLDCDFKGEDKHVK